MYIEILNFMSGNLEKLSKVTHLGKISCCLVGTHQLSIGCIN